MTPYVTVDEANAYFTTRLDAQPWEKADDQTRQAALVTATRRIDMQRLRRRWVGAEDAPQAVKDACCEEALFMLSMTDWDKTRRRQNELGVVSASVGDANEYAQQSVVQQLATGGLKLMSPAARQLLAPWRVGAATIV